MILSESGLGSAASTCPGINDRMNRVGIAVGYPAGHAGCAGELLAPPERHVTVMILSVMGSVSERGCRYTFLEDARYT